MSDIHTGYTFTATALVALIQFVAAQDNTSLDVVALSVAGVVAGVLFLVVVVFSCLIIRSSYNERKYGSNRQKSRILAIATDNDIEVSTTRSRATSAGPESSLIKGGDHWANREKMGKAREEKEGTMDFEEEIIERKDGVVKKKDHTPHTPLAEDVAEDILRRSQKRGSRLSRQSHVSSRLSESTNQQGTPKKKKISDNSRKLKNKEPIEGLTHTENNSAQVQNGDGGGSGTPPLELSQTRDPEIEEPANEVADEDHVTPVTFSEPTTIEDPAALEPADAPPDSPANHSPKPSHFRLPDEGGVYKVQVN